MRFFLTKPSDGQRGAMGKRKMYEIFQADKTVIIEYGMLERGENHSEMKEFDCENSAKEFALDKYYSKVKKGYEVIEKVW